MTENSMKIIANQLKDYLLNTDTVKLKQEWDELSDYDDVGPTVDEFLLSLGRDAVFEINDLSLMTENINETSNYYSEFFYLYKVII